MSIAITSLLEKKKKQIIIVAYSPTCSELLVDKSRLAFLEFFKTFLQVLSFLLNRLIPTNLYRAEFDILFTFWPFPSSLCTFMCVWMYSQGHSLFQFPHLSHGSQLPMSLHNFRYWTLSEKTIPAKSNGGFCSLMPILEAGGLWGPTVSRRFHSNKACADPLHCDR
jgi:hypothetical protein